MQAIYRFDQIETIDESKIYRSTGSAKNRSKKIDQIERSIRIGSVSLSGDN